MRMVTTIATYFLLSERRFSCFNEVKLQCGFGWRSTFVFPPIPATNFLYTILMWFVYILLCENGSFYTGIAIDPQKRLLVHKSGKGARYTKIYKPVALVYIEQLSSQTGAMKRERELKSWPRKRKEKLVQDYALKTSDNNL